MNIPYVNFSAQTEKVLPELKLAFEKVILNGNFILGPEVTAFEKEIADYCSAKYAIGVSNGTSALILALKALEIGPGDEVLVPSNSFIASTSAVALVGATPILCEPSLNSLNLDINLITSRITNKTKAIMPVHMAGRSCNMKQFLKIADEYGLMLIEDAAQSIGASNEGIKVGSSGHVACFSLHPLKNLHAFGDAGFITTNDEKLVEKIKLLRNLGLQSRENCIVFSSNDRLDELQAALLRVNLKNLDAWTMERRKLAHYYNESLKELVDVPLEDKNEFHVYQTYVIKCKNRNNLMSFLTEKGIDAKIHYPLGIHEQDASKILGYKKGDLPITEQLCSQIISLPLYPGLTLENQNYIIETIRNFYESTL